MSEKCPLIPILVSKMLKLGGSWPSLNFSLFNVFMREVNLYHTWDVLKLTKTD